MLIETKLPVAVGATMSLPAAFPAQAAARGISDDRAAILLDLIPKPLIDAGCFLDNITGLWKYEFGAPLQLSRGSLLGTEWKPVAHLVAVVDAVERVLPDRQRRRYLARLADPHAHDVALSEFMPVVWLGHDVACEFEFRTGQGNKDADWCLRKPGQRPVLIEVKRRISDLIDIAEAALRSERKPNGHAPQPRHDVNLLFRSVANKFPKTPSSERLQGAWVHTALMQETSELRRAFDDLEPRRVHFAVLGGWERGVLVMTRELEDEATLLEVLGQTVRRDAWQFVRG
jgi:hypothetical protein